MEKLKVTVMKNGPLRIEGDLDINDPAGKCYDLGGRTILSLCRCGFSGNKPFCDGSHKQHGFEHEPEAFDLPPKKTA
jgi:CDGSH-type Zn-finger protein